jgi:hypothetical protein
MNAPKWTEPQQAILREWWATSNPIRLWAHLLDKGEDAIIGKARRMNLGPRPRNWKPTYVHSWICIEQLLSDGIVRSVPEIAERTGFNASVVRKQMKDRIGLQVYVSEWRLEGTKYVAHFALGAFKPNARRPKPKTHAEKQRLYYERRKRFRPDDHEEHLRKRRLLDASKRAAPKTADIAASWITNAQTIQATPENGVQEESAESQAQGEQGIHGASSAATMRSLSAFRIPDLWRGSASFTRGTGK